MTLACPIAVQLSSSGGVANPYGPHSSELADSEFRVIHDNVGMEPTKGEWFTVCSNHEKYYHRNTQFESRKREN